MLVLLCGKIRANNKIQESVAQMRSGNRDGPCADDELAQEKIFVGRHRFIRIQRHSEIAGRHQSMLNEKSMPK